MVRRLDNLPYDVYRVLEPFIRSCADLLALAQCNRTLSVIFVEALYQHALRGPCDQKALFWAVSKNSIDKLRPWIRPGTKLDILWWFDRHPRYLRNLIRTTQGISCPGSVYDASYRLNPFHDSLGGLKNCPLIGLAAATGNVEIIELLLDHGVRTDVGCLGLCDCPSRPRRLSRPWRPLYHREMGDVPSAHERLWTPLHIALCKGHIDAAKLLASRGHTESMTHLEALPDGDPADNNRRSQAQRLANPGQNHPSHYTPAVVYDLHLNPLAPNLRQYLEPDELGPPGPRPLHGACLAGRLSFLKWVLEESGITLDINKRDAFGHPAIAYAYLYEHWDCVHYLLDKGASINAIVQRRRHGNIIRLDTILSGAFFHLNISDVNKLLDLGAEGSTVCLNSSDPARGIFAHICTTSWSLSTDPNAAQNLPSFLKMMLDRVLEESLDGGLRGFFTGLLPPTCEAGNPDAVRCLIEHGADVNDSNNQDMLAPLDYACKDLNPDSRAETIAILLDHGASPHGEPLNKTPPLWVLYHLGGTGEEDETSSQYRAFDMLLRRGARPYRGTSGRLPDAENRAVSPLDDLVRKGEWETFHRVLERCIDPPVIGEDDILGFWNALTPDANGPRMRKVIDADENNINIIASRARSPVQSLLAVDPIPRDLVVAMLEKVANPDEQAGMSCLARAVERGVDTALFKMLLDRGGEPRAITASQPVLNHVIAAHKSPLLDNQRRKEFAMLLHDAGVSPYERLRKSMYFSLPDYVPLTYLAHAIYKKTGNQEIVKMFLTREPLSHRQPTEALRHVELICRQGHKVALESAIALQDGDGISITFIITENVLKLVHLLLDNVYGAHADGSEVDAAIGCLEILLRHAQAKMLDEAAPTGSPDTRTAREKLTTLGVNYGSPARVKMAMVSGCFQRRMRFEEGKPMPRFVAGGH